MPAITSTGSGIEVIDRPDRPLDPVEARIRTRLAGICRTDLQIVGGYMGFKGVLGHEFVGDVVESTDPAWEGARVVGDINCACLGCSYCNRGLLHHCPNRTVLGILGRDGAFQDTFTLPTRNLVRVPPSIPDEQAVFAEPLAAALRVLEQVDLSPWQRVAIIGDGRLGSLVAFVLAERVHSITLFGRHPGRVAFPITVEERPALSAGDVVRERFEVVVEASGSSDGLAAALRLVEPLGTIVLKTTCAASHSLSLAPAVIDEVRIIGSRCGSLPAAVEWLSRGRLPLHQLIQGRFTLADGRAAFARAGEPGVLKVLIEGAART